VADLLRGPYGPHEYGKVILPMTVLRRLDCALELLGGGETWAENMKRALIAFGGSGMLPAAARTMERAERSAGPRGGASWSCRAAGRTSPCPNSSR
jgi:hypothetical protein